jgi:hypothetical protein
MSEKDKRVMKGEELLSKEKIDNWKKNKKFS